MKTALILGGSGFIGSHMAKHLKDQGYWVRCVDKDIYQYGELACDDFILGDLSDYEVCERAFALNDTYFFDTPSFDIVYNFVCLMGGSQYIFTKENDADIMHESTMCNLNIAKCAYVYEAKKLFYSSSACVYNYQNQETTVNPNCEESSAYPAYPDSCYGWHKLYSEILFDAFARNYGLDIRIARFHNIFGENGAWNTNKAKSPAAICRKVAQCPDGGEIEIWGTGEQTRSFLYIDECIEGIQRLIESDYTQPINIGSEEMISINNLARMAIEISGKNITIKNVDSNAIGVMGRNSDNRLIRETLGWEPTQPLRVGIEKLYRWIEGQIKGKE